MIYEVINPSDAITEKKLRFKVGEYVFHKCDAKKPHMLMIVDSIDERNGLIETHYIDEKFVGRKWHGYESELRLNNEAGEGGQKYKKRTIIKS